MKLPLGKPAVLTGRVTDLTGKPIAGATVFTRGIFDSMPTPGANSATTDADGNYTINDMWTVDLTKQVQKPKKFGNGLFAVAVPGFPLFISHPNYCSKRLYVDQALANNDVQLEPAGKLSGKAIIKSTGKAAAGVVVAVKGKPSEPGDQAYHKVKTDTNGNYLFPSLRPGKYDLVTFSNTHVSVALDAQEVKVGETSQAPEVLMIEGGWIEGEIIDAQTGSPLSLTLHTRKPIEISVYGAFLPRSKSLSKHLCVVDKQGKFRIQVAPGLNYPTLEDSMTYDPQGSGVPHLVRLQEDYSQGVMVREGEVVKIVMSVLGKQVKAPLKVLAIPVAEERFAAEAVHELGGLYKVDEQQNVVEVIMVYHDNKMGERQDHTQKDIDKALSQMRAFRKLKRLYLSKELSNDHAMETIGTFSGLEQLSLSGPNVDLSNVGIKQLAGLRELEVLSLQYTSIGDESIKVIGGFHKLKSLTLEECSIKAVGIKHLAGLTGLKFLTIIPKEEYVTDEGMDALVHFKQLEFLSLRSRLTDAGVTKIGGLTKLKRIYLRGTGSEATGITDGCVSTLLKLQNLEDLQITNASITSTGAEQLCQLTRLKKLQLSTSDTINWNTNTSTLQKRHPGIQIFMFPVQKN